MLIFSFPFLYNKCLAKKCIWLLIFLLLSGIYFTIQTESQFWLIVNPCNSEIPVFEKLCRVRGQIKLRFCTLIYLIILEIIQSQTMERLVSLTHYLGGPGSNLTGFIICHSTSKAPINRCQAFAQAPPFEESLNKEKICYPIPVLKDLQLKSQIQRSFTK